MYVSIPATLSGTFIIHSIDLVWIQSIFYLVERVLEKNVLSNIL